MFDICQLRAFCNSRPKWILNLLHIVHGGCILFGFSHIILGKKYCYGNSTKIVMIFLVRKLRSLIARDIINHNAT